MVQTTKIEHYFYSKTFTLLEDHYFQEKLEQDHILFTVNQMNKTFTGTFILMPEDKNWVYDQLQTLYHICLALHQFEVNLVS